MDENFGRRSTDAQIGYLMGRVESIEDRLDEYIQAEEKHFNRLSKEVQALHESLSSDISKITEQLSMYRHFIFFIKMLFAVSAALLAFKWGAAKVAWHNFLHM